ncbi:MAG: RNA polymerase sigma factor [Woeseiaceae bacterium]|nr:RNA polymerase sigma factor [Woeseiaceae bacterium]
MASSVDCMAIATNTLSDGEALPYAARMGQTADDSALMLRYQDGDLAAFDTLYRRHNDPLYRYLLRLSQNRDTADDLFQEVWGKIVKTRARYRPTARFTTFLYRVAHNCFIDHLRRNKRHANHAEFKAESHSDPGEQPDAATERRLAKERLSKALMDLPEAQRDTFLLHEEAGLSLEQIAAVTGSNRETAKSRLRYAVNKLRVAIADGSEQK